MRVIDLHPEDLLSKDARGELSDAERARLEAHLARCATCRFERCVRDDFAEELGSAGDGAGQDLAALVEPAPRPAAGEVAPRETRETRETTASPPARRASPARRVWLLVAAALFVGGVATAAAESILRVADTPPETPATTVEREARQAVAPAPTVSTKARRIPAAARPGPTSLVSADEAPAPSTPVAEVTPAEEPPPPLAAASAASPVVEPVRSSPPPRAATAAGARLHGASAATPPPQAPPPQAPPRIADDPPRAPAETAATLFDAAAEARRRGDHARAIALHRQLAQRFPASRETNVSSAAIAQLLLDRGDNRGAQAEFDAYQSGGPAPVDEAVMVGRATALDRMGRAAEARAAWSALLASFPRSPYAAHARMRIGASSSR